MTPAVVAAAPNAITAALSKRWLPLPFSALTFSATFPVSHFPQLCLRLWFSLCSSLISLSPALVRTCCPSLSLSLPHRYSTHLSLFCLYLLLHPYLPFSALLSHTYLR